MRPYCSSWRFRLRCFTASPLRRRGYAPISPNRLSGPRPSGRATTALVEASVPDRGSNPRVLHLPSIQGGAQITIYVRLGNPFGERNGELLPLEHRATLQGADEVGEIGDETMVDSCSDDKTGRRGGLTPSCHAPISRGTQRDARRHTGKPTEPLFRKTPKRRRQAGRLTGGSRAPARAAERRRPARTFVLQTHDQGIDADTY